ncbi:MAG TPA: microviridin/marinostatin family tricyclic proteinase inhibitor [Leptolyngbyaceae cyanobacterium]
MSDQNKEDLNSEAVPFFARFLEGQSAEEMSEEEMEAVAGGKRYMTRKYPSDNEDNISGGSGGGGAVTMKYPSDQEDGGGGGAVTRK